MGKMILHKSLFNDLPMAKIRYVLFFSKLVFYNWRSRRGARTRTVNGEHTARSKLQIPRLQIRGVFSTYRT